MPRQHHFRVSLMRDEGIGVSGPLRAFFLFSSSRIVSQCTLAIQLRLSVRWRLQNHLRMQRQTRLRRSDDSGNDFPIQASLNAAVGVSYVRGCQ